MLNTTRAKSSQVFTKLTVLLSLLNPVIQGIVSVVYSCAIVAALVSIDYMTAILAGSGLAVFYWIITVITRRKLFVSGRISAECEGRRIQVIQEGLGGIRDVLIDSTQKVYVARLNKTLAAQSEARAAKPSSPRPAFPC